MKKSFMRTLAVIMAVLMIASAVPFATFAAEGDCTNPEGHAYGEEVVEKRATCTEDGLQVARCKYCGAADPTRNTVLKATGHKWTNKAEDEYLKSEACCIAPATYFKSCSVCGAKSEETFTKGLKDSSKHLNVVKDGEDRESTCKEFGYQAATKCADCGKTITPAIEEVAKKSHTPGETVATCMSGPICAVCNEEYGNKNPENHTNIVTDAAVEATCTTAGLTEGSHCEGCDAVIVAQEEISAKGHDFGDLVVPKDYKCEEGGIVYKTCKTCNYTETITRPAGSHEVVVDEAVAATCTAAGKTDGSHCKLCDTVIKSQETVPALGHDYTNGEVICNHNATHSIKCVRCGEIGSAITCSDDNSDCKCDVCGYELNHLFRTYVSNGDATCSADGTKTATCDRCGKATDTIPDVGSKDPNAHKYNYVKTTDATCIADAKETGTCSLCGATTVREIANSKLGHAASEWIYSTDYDCVLGGVRRYKTCTRCGELVDYEEEAPDRAHNIQKDPAVAETCTKDGKTEGSHCTFCGKVIEEQITIPATGHEAKDGIFVEKVKADCTTDGLKEATCGKCGEIYTVKVDATGHKYAVTAVAATCTKDGYKLHKCTVCGDEYTDSIVKKTGHKFKDTVTPAKYHKKGQIVSTCTVCGASATTKIYRIEKLTLSQTTFVRDGKAHKPTVTVTDYKGKVLKKGTDYTVKYESGRKAIGTYKVTVTFKGNYAGTRTLKFKIVPAKVKDVKVTAGKASAKVSWGKVKYATTYVVYAATAKNGTYKKVGATDKLTLNATKLEKGKTYYFKVKAGRKTNSGVVYGDFSAVKKAKIK